MSKTCYIKCADNKQAQELRPYLVEVGFVDDKEWNEVYTGGYSFILITPSMVFGIFSKEIVALSDDLIHTVPLDADLSEQAKLIKELFEKQ